ncbi:hypothetical protein BSNK01_21420 [Bacillaceae bacterium]
MELEGEGPLSDRGTAFQGKGWRCEIDEEAFFTFMQSRIPIVTVTFTANDERVLAEIVGKFRFKTMRAGG